MTRFLKDLPLSLIFFGVSAVMMYFPVFFIVQEETWATGRAFFYSATIFLTIFFMLAIVTRNSKPTNPVRRQLLSLLLAYLVLPVILAVPLWESVAGTSFVDVYFEMVSSFTTTGATVFDPGELNSPQHVWRGLVGWMGGFLTWCAAIAILAPLNLGGFEVLQRGQPLSGSKLSQINSVADPEERLIRYATSLFPTYFGLTSLLWLGLVAAGDTPTVALIHAMSTLATSGISPLSDLSEANSGMIGEGFILLFFVFALSRQTFANDTRDKGSKGLLFDQEIRLGVTIIIGVSMVLFLRHWLGAFETETQGTFENATQSFWGGMFTVASFLTNTGFQSGFWADASAWSTLETPGFILLGLAMIGGGVATTAGGVKLLRVLVLYQHGQRELERLVHPSSVGGAAGVDRSGRRNASFMAWIFFMLFAISIAAVMLALSFLGIGFEPAVILTVSALSTTGPLANIAGEFPIFYTSLPDGAKIVLIFTMVLGRLETLALIALFNPEFWR